MMRTESANELLMGKNRDFISADLCGLKYVTDLMLGHISMGSAINEDLTTEEKETAEQERLDALKANREHWKNASEYEQRKYPELYSQMRYIYGF